MHATEDVASFMLILMHLSQLGLIVTLLHPRNRRQSSSEEKRIFQRWFLGLCVLLLVTGVTFTTLCFCNRTEWDIFTHQTDISLLSTGKFELYFTYQWFEIELFAMPSQMLYYYFAYRYYLVHRKKKSMGANKFVRTMKGDLGT